MEENVDLEEFNRQRIEAGKKKGNYSEIIIFLEEGENSPLTQLSFKGISNETMAKNIIILKNLQEHLEQQYPIAMLMSKNMEAKAINIEGKK